MAKHNVSRAAELFSGDVYYPGYNDTHKRPGVKMTPLTWANIGAPELGDLDLLVDAATGASEMPNANTVTHTADDDGSSPLDNGSRPSVSTIKMANGDEVAVWTLDVPRALQARNVADTGDTVAVTITITGYDEYKEKVVEELTLAATATNVTVAGKKAMKYVRSIAITSASDATADTVEVGTSDVIGLPFRFDNADEVVVFEDGAIATAGTLVAAVTTDPATASTGDVRGTINPDMTLNGTRRLTVLMAVDASSKEAAFGVAQYAG